MKGMVFTSLLEMIENRYGYEMVDKIITESGVSSNGVYTSVGTYDFKEMQQLFDFILAKIRGRILMKFCKFGRYFFQVMTSIMLPFSGSSIRIDFSGFY
ncbi:MAG: heme NO-binding domain-containing protein [Saprospiraceae bacterium]